MGQITFGAFPRSGNHFLQNIVKCNWINHRITEFETLENVITLIRNPLECIPSWIVMVDDCRTNRAESVLEWYCAYYQKCKELNILVIPFEQLISEPLFCINYVYKKLGFELLETLDYDLSTNFHGPTKDKSDFNKIVEEMKIAPNFHFAMDLFKELCVPLVG